MVLLKLEKKLGEGSFGIVYRIALGPEKYAMKMEKKKGAMRNEAAVLRALAHSSIPTVISTGMYQGHLFVVLPLYRVSMVQVLATNRKFFDSRTVAAIGWNLVGVLEYIHAKGLVYRDVKPENIMLGFDNRIYLVDFGLCTPIGSGKGTLAGTPRYASVSAHRGLPSCPSDDLESLLYALVFMLKGGLPWAEIADVKKIGEMKESENIAGFLGLWQWDEFIRLVMGRNGDYKGMKEVLIRILNWKERGIKKKVGFMLWDIFMRLTLCC